MNVWLSKSAEKLRKQIDAAYLHRDKRSDGWIGDSKHANTVSQHNPDPKTRVVRAIDIDSDLDLHKSTSIYLADQIRKCAKRDARIAYVIHAGKIASPILNWKWRKYRGTNPHHSHIHISFTPLGDNDGRVFNIPMLEEDK